MIRKVLLCAALLALAASSGFGYSDADKVFSVSHSDLGANGSVISTWGMFTKTGATGFDPTVQTLTDPVTSQSVKWGKPAAGTLDGSGNTTAGGSGFNSGIIDGIVNTGFTLVTAIIPSINALGSSDYRSIVNAYLGGLGLYQMDNGKVCLRLEKTYNTYNTFTTGTGILTDGTRTVLSLVVSNTGVYELWKDVITGGVTVRYGNPQRHILELAVRRFAAECYPYRFHEYFEKQHRPGKRRWPQHRHHSFHVQGLHR